MLPTTQNKAHAQKTENTEEGFHALSVWNVQALAYATRKISLHGD